MAIRKELGKISSVSFGHGGYQDVQIGLSVSLEMGGAGVSDFKGNWSPSFIKWSPTCKWTEADRDAGFAELVRYIDKLLKQAKVSDVSKLKGIPVEVTIEGNTLKSWRILTEVL